MHTRYWQPSIIKNSIYYKETRLQMLHQLCVLLVRSAGWNINRNCIGTFVCLIAEVNGDFNDWTVLLYAIVKSGNPNPPPPPFHTHKIGINLSYTEYRITKQWWHTEEIRQLCENTNERRQVHQWIVCINIRCRFLPWHNCAMKNIS